MNAATPASPLRFFPRLPVLLLAVLVLCGLVSAARADTLDGVLQVRSAEVDLDKGVFNLKAQIDYPMSEAISTALRDGVPLIFDVNARVERERRLWVNATLVELTLHRELTYHTVSDRYIVTGPESGDQQTFATLDAALMYLGTVEDWPILVESQLAPDERYTVSVRAGIRRGHLSASLRALLFWTNDWNRVSDWYTWSLTN